MFCKKCGKEIQDGDQFCPYCGAKNTSSPTEASPMPKIPPMPEISPMPENPNLKSVQKKKSKANIWIIAIVCIILLVMAGVCIYLFAVNQTNRKHNEDSYPDIAIEEGKEAPPDTGTDPEEGGKGLKEDETFQIEEVDDADYKQVLEPNQYETYASEYDSFSFSYPTNLYASVEEDDSSEHTPYGTNLQTVTFSGNDGSELKYSISERTDTMSVNDFDQSVFAMESESLVDAESIKHSTDDGTGRIIFSGFTDAKKSKVVYDVVRIYNKYVMQMKITTPGYTTTEDKQEKSYYTECMYRLCGFSGSKKVPRTYAEFQAGE